MSSEKIRVFIGTEPKTEIARKVLECSIKRRCTAEGLDLVPMIGPEWECDVRGIPVGTGFSLKRWLIPSRCNWTGKAIYLDADQLVLADIKDLWESDQTFPAREGTSAWTTWQADSISKTPWPQSSVMLIDCKAAKNQKGWHPEYMLSYLKSHPTLEEYHKWMHCQWMDPEPGKIPDRWNHLDKLDSSTSIIHFTSEPNQPWYNPKHKHALVWRQELVAAIGRNEIEKQELEYALSQWNVKQDWRDKNGLHPDYKSLLPLFPYKKPIIEIPPISKLLWITSFNRKLWEASGKHLVETFLFFAPQGDFLVFLEDDKRDYIPSNIRTETLDLSDPDLATYLERNKKVIPVEQGGSATEPMCLCADGPYAPDSPLHDMPCPGQWFNKHNFRWFKKMWCWNKALTICKQEGYDAFVWLDCDCRFVSRGLTIKEVDKWFHGRPVFYFKHTRPVMETGIVGFFGAHAEKIIKTIMEWCLSGRNRTLVRWDDSYILQKAMNRLRIVGTDLAIGVTTNAQVIPGSAPSAWLTHDKGTHKRMRMFA